MFTLNGQLVKLPCKTLSIGLDMQCHHVVTSNTILSVNEENDEVIVESEDGIKLLLHMKDLDTFYVDTKENRDRLEAQCRKEYIEWKEAVRKQIETCSRRY